MADLRVIEGDGEGDGEAQLPEAAVEAVDMLLWDSDYTRPVAGTDANRRKLAEECVREASFPLENALREAMKLTAETVVCCDCAGEAKPSCEMGGHGLVTLGELIEAYS